MNKVIYCIFAVLTVQKFCVAQDENNEFSEIDARKTYKDSYVKFGARINTDIYDRHAEQFKSIGPTFQLAYWMVVREVSGAAPAPHNANDDVMNAWINSVYFYLQNEFEVMENTSNRLVNEGIQLTVAALTPPNSYYNTPKGIKRFKEQAEAIKKGDEIKAPDEDDWIKIAEEKAKEDPSEQYNLLMTDSIRDLAKFWAASVDFLQKQKMTLPLLELTWEPDDKSLVYILPEDYATAVKLVREELRNRGIADDRNGIVGPGTSNPVAAKQYIEALAKDREAYDNIHSWSIHVHDRGESVQDVEKELLGFKQILKATVPSSWPKKPVVVTSFGYQPNSNAMVGDVVHNGDMEMCYKNILGLLQKREDTLPNTMAQSPKIGVRILSELLVQYSLGFSNSIYEEIADENWSYACKGLFDRQNRRKQIFVALSSFLQHIPKDAKVVKKQWKNSKDCVSAIVKAKSRIVISVANPSSTSCTRSFSLSGLPTNQIGEGFTQSYNNGTVSLDASNAAEALLVTTALDYDIFEDEDRGKVVEFDIVIGPHASATAVIKLNASKAKPNKNEEASVESSSTTVHSEL